MNGHELPVPGVQIRGGAVQSEKEREKIKAREEER